MLTISKTKVIILLVLLIFLLSQYKIFMFNPGFVLLQFFAVIVFLYDRSLRVQWHFVVFLASIFILLLINLFLYQRLNHGTGFYYLNGIALCIAVFVASKYLNPSKMYRWYAVLGGAASLACILQGFYIAITGDPLTPIQLFPVEPEKERLWLASMRPSGFFTEPQLFASFVLPLLWLSLLKGRIVMASLVSIGIMSSGSTYGLLIMLALFMLLLKKFSIWDLPKTIFSLMVAASVLAMLEYNSGIFSAGLEKLVKTDFSEGIRVAKAPLLFWEMTTFEKMFGMASSVENFIEKNLYLFPWLLRYVESESILLGYVTGFFALGISFGVIPMFAFLWMLHRIYARGDRFQQGIVCIIFLHSISATVLFNAYFLFFFILLFANSFDGSSKVKYMELKL